MAKGAYLKKLFKSYQEGDSELFKSVAQLIIEDERSKNHFQLADELQRIINATVSRRKSESNFEQNYFHLLPKDKDSNHPLLDVKQSRLILDDVVLTRESREILDEFVNEYERTEILEAYGLKSRNKLLFCGPPGCGKTVTAEAIAGELNVPMLYTRFDSIVSSYLGETASNIRKVFEFASKGTWVLFFDEFDAIAKSRDNVDEHGELKRVVNSFLQLLDNYQGNSIIIAATNHQRLLDSAIWRRFDEVLAFPLPEDLSIEKLLKKHFKRYPTLDLQISEIAEQLVGFSHADIERLCLTTIKRAILKGEPYITNEALTGQIQLYKIRNAIYKT